VVLATGGIGMATLTRLHNRHLFWNKEKLMRARKLIARSSLLIWVIACGSLIASGQNRRAEPKSASQYPLITCEELKQLIDAKATQDIVIVDTQPSESFAEAHIPGAVNLPYTDRIKRPVNLSRTKTLVLYCPCEHEEESTEMATQLQKLGYSKLKLLQGGLPRWQELQYPTVKISTEENPSEK
jgi:rhodanese-related sulfurtransferase